MNPKEKSSPSIPIVLRGLLALFAPADRREEFLGDLLEEAHRRTTRDGRARVALWLWWQALASLPPLVILRWRRLWERPRAVAAAAPAVEPLSRQEVGRAFSAFMGESRAKRGKPMTLVLSISFHAAVLVAASVQWREVPVDELEPERPVSVIFRPPTMGRPQGPGPKPPQVKKQQMKKVTRAALTQPTKAVNTPEPPSSDPPTNVVGPPGDPGTGDGERECEGPDCERPTSHTLPPRVAEKSCLECPPPRLPEGMVRMGLDREMLVKTCVDTRGLVKSVQVLRGIDPAVDAGVAEHIGRWLFSPLRVNEHPVPFCYVTRFVFTSR